MSKYTGLNFNRLEIAVIREILNDSGVHFKHMAETHVSLEQRIADRLDLDERTVSRIATDVWRMFDNAGGDKWNTLEQ